MVTVSCHYDMSMSPRLWNPVDTNSGMPLADLRVVDMADEKGETCGRFLADLGADVIRVEPPGGGASRAAALAFAVRNANKRGVTLDLGAPADHARLFALLESADVWIETTRPGTLARFGLGADDVLARNPQLVITSITDFGQSGAYRDWESNDAIQVALSGILSRSGLAGRDPLPPPPGMAYETTAIQAAWATLVAYWNRLRTGRGDHVDFSILEAAVQIMDPAYGAASVSRASAFPSSRGRPAAGLYPIFPCADGHVRVVVLAPRQWRAMRAWLGEPAAFQDARYDTIAARLDAAAELHGLYAALFAGKLKDAIASEGQARGVPIAPVLDVSEVLASAHFQARGAFTDAEVAPGVRGRLPSGFLELDGARLGFRHRAPEPGEHNHLLSSPGGAAGAQRGGARRARAPAAGRAARRRFRDHRDRQRDRAGARRSGRGRDQGREPRLPRRRARRLRRRALAQLRRRQPQQAQLRRRPAHAGGRALLKRLVAEADVVLENFKPGTLERLGLGYETLRAVNPGVVMLSTNALGSSGPWSGWLGYGPIVRCVSGIAASGAIPTTNSLSASRRRSTPTTTARACARRRCWRR